MRIERRMKPAQEVEWFRRRRCKICMHWQGVARRYLLPPATLHAPVAPSSWLPRPRAPALSDSNHTSFSRTACRVPHSSHVRAAAMGRSVWRMKCRPPQVEQCWGMSPASTASINSCTRGVGGGGGGITSRSSTAGLGRQLRQQRALAQLGPGTHSMQAGGVGGPAGGPGMEARLLPACGPATRAGCQRPPGPRARSCRAGAGAGAGQRRAAFGACCRAAGCGGCGRPLPCRPWVYPKQAARAHGGGGAAGAVLT